MTMGAITLRQMEFFCAAVEHGSISRAADALHLSQPSISEQLRKLERAVGVALLRRTNQGLRLTSAGTTFHVHAARALAAADAAVSAVQPADAAEGQLVAFGTFSSAHAYVLTDVITAFRTRYPGVRVRITTQNSAETAARVRNGALEAGLVALPVDVRDLHVSSVVWRSEAVFVTPAGAPAASARAIQDVVQSPLILPEARQGNADPTRRQLAQRAADAGLRLAPAIEVEHGSTALDLVAQGVGNAVVSLPLIHALGFDDRVQWTRLDPPLAETFAFISRRGVAVSAPAHDLVRLATTRLRALQRLGVMDQRDAHPVEHRGPVVNGEAQACDSA